MILALFCLVFAIFMFIAISYSVQNIPNGRSIYILQRVIGILDYALCRFRIFTILLFSVSPDESSPIKVEKIVWLRLVFVSALFILFDYILRETTFGNTWYVRMVFCVYILLLQLTMIISLLKPLFGVKRIGKGLDLDLTKSSSLTVEIPTPKRSLLLALVNFFEIVLSWGIVYRSIMPSTVDTSDKANYFSIVTLTTLGYGDINGGNASIVQIAITLNMIIFVLFSICHITTILGSLTSGK